MATEPTAPTKATALFYIAGYLMGDPGGHTGEAVITVKPTDTLTFASKKPNSGRNLLVSRFGDSAVALGGKAVYTVSGKKDKVAVTGITLTLETTKVPTILNGASVAQQHAFLAALVETEGSKDGKLADDPGMDHIKAIAAVANSQGIQTWVKDGATMRSAWVSTDADAAKFQTYPFVQWGRVPVRGSADPAPGPLPPPVQVKAKAISVGILTRDGRPLPAKAGTIVHVPLSSLAPSGTTFNAKVLTDAIAAAKTIGAASATLSVDGGSEESDANKKAYGQVTLQDPQGTRPPHSVIAMWKDDYQAHIKDLLPKIADVVEDDPFVREVMYSWGGAEFSVEWTIREASTPANRQAWLSQGFDAELDMANILAAPAMFKAAGFAKTRMAVFTSMFYQHIYPDGTMKQDKDFTAKWLDAATTLLPNIVLGINNADLASYGPNRPEIYNVMLAYAQKGFARHDQTVTAVKMGGTTGCVKFFGQANLALMTKDLVFAQEPPRGWGLTTAQVQAAQDQLVAAAIAAGWA
jgi:hypothetical protein